MHKVDPLTRHAWCYGLLTALLFDVEDEGEEAFDVRGGNIVSVRSLDQRFSFEVEDGDQAGHCERNKMSGRGRVKGFSLRATRSSSLSSVACEPRGYLI